MTPGRPARKKRPAARPTRSRPKEGERPRFVGRDPSPVLDHYPPKNPAAAPGSSLLPLRPTSVVATSTRSTGSGAATPLSSTPPGQPLITLDRPFDPDEFSNLLGENSIKVTVPRDALPEVLRRVTEFMGFGIYVYSIAVRPAPSDLLKSFVVELTRVDYSAEKGQWVPFVDKGTTDSPFGPSGNRT